MARQQLLALIFVAVLAFVNPSLAGPSCARRYRGRDDCPAKCRRGFGYPGRAMGTDPWGQVMTTTVTELDTVVTKACRVRLKSKLASSAAAGPTQAIANVGNRPSPSISTSTSPLPSTSARPVKSSPSPSAAAVTNGFIRPSAKPVEPSTSAPPPPPPPSSETKPSPTPEAPPVAPSPPPEPVTTIKEQPKPKPTTTSQPPPPQTTKKADPPAQSPSSDQGNNNGSGSSSGATSQSDINQYLSAHNSIRAQHGAKDLTWSDDLAAKAQQWANNCVFKHSGGTLGAFGENLAAGTGGAYNIASAVKSWTDEVKDYDPNNPQPSHFTQVVWKGSTQVGCALQSCNGIFDASFGAAKYFVCEYSPQGNIIGKFGENVQV